VVKHSFDSVEYEAPLIAVSVPILSIYDANDCDVKQAKKRKKRTLSHINDFTQRAHQTNKKNNCF
jgi:hypothetical protein